MAHVIEAAPTGRSKCRGCGKGIAAKEMRFGEKRPNPFGEGEATQWFHLPCAAYKRPEPFLEALAERAEPQGEREKLEADARLGIAHERLPRIDGAGRSPSGRAACRHCKEAIEKGAWRIKLIYFEEGMFQPSGFLHLKCAPDYFGTSEVLARVRHFSPDLTDTDAKEIGAAID